MPNRFVIRYRGKELEHHSLGQRASALLLYVLSQRQNDVIIIDQPEDDLDNQTIYDDVIKLLREMKPHAQFIFATHNANFPVLGDAEQVHACQFQDEKVAVQSGSIDARPVQDAIKPSTEPSFCTPMKIFPLAALLKATISAAKASALVKFSLDG